VGRAGEAQRGRHASTQAEAGYRQTGRQEWHGKSEYKCYATHGDKEPAYSKQREEDEEQRRNHKKVERESRRRQEVTGEAGMRGRGRQADAQAGRRGLQGWGEA